VIKAKAASATRIRVEPRARRDGEAPDLEALAAALALTPDEIALGFMRRALQRARAFVFVPWSHARRSNAPTVARGFRAGSRLRRRLCLYTDETIARTAPYSRACSPWRIEDPASGAARRLRRSRQEFERPTDGEHQIFIEQGHNIGRPRA